MIELAWHLEASFVHVKRSANSTTDILAKEGVQWVIFIGFLTLIPFCPDFWAPYLFLGAFFYLFFACT